MNRRGTLTRVAGGGLAVGLLALTAATLWSYGSTPTDEDLFTDPPSFVYVARPVASALAVGPGLSEATEPFDDQTVVVVKATASGGSACASRSLAAIGRRHSIARRRGRVSPSSASRS
jgi:hypothetical protein